MAARVNPDRTFFSALTSSVVFAAIALSAVPAHAADQTVDETAFTPAAPILYDWAGLYAGVSVGASFDAFDSRYGVPSVSRSFDPTGASGGVLAGVNFQNGSFVYGVEADASFKLGDDTQVVAGIPMTAQNDWFSTLRGRAGYAIDNYLFYGTGGLAIGDVEVSGRGGSVSDTKVGWTLGAGVEAALTDNFTLRGEYLYTDLGTTDGTIAGSPFSTEFDSHTIRAGVTYTFK